MKLSLLLAGASVAQAMVSYMAHVPESIMAPVESSECTMPTDYQIHDFIIDSPDGGQTTQSLSFTFNDPTTGLRTKCHLDALSVPASGEGRRARYPCYNDMAMFMWQGGAITMIERICPEGMREAKYEAAGTAIIPIVCNKTMSGVAGRSPRRNNKRVAGCHSTLKSIQARFVSFNPAPGW